MKLTQRLAYVVREEEVEGATADDLARGCTTEQAICVCASEAQALALAKLYDRGLAEPDNCVFEGTTIVALQESQLS